MQGLIRRWPVTALVVIAIGWTTFFVSPVVITSRGAGELWLGKAFWELVGALGPLVAGFVVIRALHGADGVRALWRGMWHWRVPAPWLLFSLLSPFVILLAAMLWNRLSTGAWPDFSVLPAGEFGTLAGLLNVLLLKSIWQGVAEEPGWRGVMLPLLRERHGPLLASVVLWPFWLVWHLPFFLARPEFGWVQFAGFSLGILSAAIWLTLIWDMTRSVLMAIAWHALINLTRFYALALSPAMFLQFSLLVTIGAVPIVLWWLLRRPGPVAMDPGHPRAA